MDKRKKLINLQAEICVDPEFYKSRHPQETTEVARMLVFGAYSESELDEKSRENLKRHFENCSFCSKAFTEFEGTGDLQTMDRIPAAVCPSSETLDCYQFDRGLLSAPQTERIERHLQECKLCSEELEWLKNLETPRKREQFSSTWLQSALAAAAAVVLAVSTFVFWEKSTGRVAEQELRTLAAIQEPDQINYSALIETSKPLSEETQPVFDQALEAFRAHRFREASTLLEDVVRKQPQHSASSFLLAHSYYRLNQAEKAFKLCSLSESIHPHSFERCIFLVNLALKTGHFDRARLEIATLHHEAPNAPEVKRLYHEIMRLTGSTRRL